MKKTDFLMGLVWLMAGVAILLKSHSLGLGTLRHPGLGMTPFLIGSFLTFFSICILFSSHDVKGSLREFRSAWEGVNGKTIGLVLLYLVGYAFLIEKIGYLVVTFIFFLFLLKTIGSMKLRTTVMVSLASVLVSYGLFVLLLKVPLPSGFWRIG
jgi:putative tricarboxylic transport membrane protein